MTAWNGFSKQSNPMPPEKLPEAIPQMGVAKESETTSVSVCYMDAPNDLAFLTLQQNLQSCLTLVDHEVMKGYVSTLQDCKVITFEPPEGLADMHFFRITQLVYQEDEPAVQKLETVFETLTTKPCTLALMIQSDGSTNEFYLGVRARYDEENSTGTMKGLLENSLLGLFPGSVTQEHGIEMLADDIRSLKEANAVTSVTGVADYKQQGDAIPDNKSYFQGLEKLVDSMRGKKYTAIFLANNLTPQDIRETRREYERIYTLISPFSTMQYNYALSKSSSVSDSDSEGTQKGHMTGTNQNAGVADMKGTAHAVSENSSSAHGTQQGTNRSASSGGSTTKGETDSTSKSTSMTVTISAFKSKTASVGIEGSGVGKSSGVSGSVARSHTSGTSHSDSISRTISQNLTYGMNASQTYTTTAGTGTSDTTSNGTTISRQFGTSESDSISASLTHTATLSNTFGDSQAVTLNIQNKALLNILERLEVQMKRLQECESVGMWDFAAYFLGESVAETGTAASIYRSLMAGNQSGVESSAVNTWIVRDKDDRVHQIKEYLSNFLHPLFAYQSADGGFERRVLVDATALVSTKELAIQLGLPRNSVKGLSVIEHASFAQEVLRHSESKADAEDTIRLGKVYHLGKDTDTPVSLDLPSLAMHTFVTGSTGAGKSNTVFNLLGQIIKAKKTFLVIEPAKGEYKHAFSESSDIIVYGTSPTDRLLRINPFSFPKGVHILEHLDRLVEIFNVCWPMYAAMPAVLKEAIERAYQTAGWDLRRSLNKYDVPIYPRFDDVIIEVENILNESAFSTDNKGDYTGALTVRLRSLTNGINGMILVNNGIPDELLFDRNVIVDLSRVGASETKALIMGLLILKLQEYRQTQSGGVKQSLRHVTVLEEAHNLLKRTSTEQNMEGANLTGKSVEMLANAIAEMRAYGEGFVIADQAPGLMDMSVIRNTNTKIIMRLPDQSDRELVGRAIGLNDGQIKELSKLETGVAAIYQNDWLQPILCRVPEFSMAGGASSSRRLIDKDDGQEQQRRELLKSILHKTLLTQVEKIGWEKFIKLNLPTGFVTTVLEHRIEPDSFQNLRCELVYTYLDAAKLMSRIPFSASVEEYRRKALKALDSEMDDCSGSEKDLILFMIVREQAERDTKYQQLYIRFSNAFSGR